MRQIPPCQIVQHAMPMVLPRKGRPQFDTETNPKDQANIRHINNDNYIGPVIKKQTYFKPTF